MSEKAGPGINEREPIIRIQNLSKSFSSGSGELKVLENIDLEINGGDIFDIIGVSGAGKSALVRCINFLEKPMFGKGRSK